MACVMSLATYWRMQDLGVGEVGTGNLQQPPPPNLRAPAPPAPGVPFGISGERALPPSHPNLQDQLKQLKLVRSSPPTPPTPGLQGAGGVGAALGKRMEENKTFLLGHSLFSQRLLEI